MGECKTNARKCWVVYVPLVKSAEGLSTHPWLQEWGTGSLDSVTDIALGLSVSGQPLWNTETLQDLLRISIGIRRCNRAWRGAEGCVSECASQRAVNQTILGWARGNIPSRLLPGGKSKEWRKSLLASSSAFSSGLLCFPLLGDYIRVLVRYCFLLELGTFPKAVQSAQYSCSLSQAILDGILADCTSAECLQSCLTSSCSCIVSSSFDRFFTVSLTWIGDWSVLS